MDDFELQSRNNSVKEILIKVEEYIRYGKGHIEFTLYQKLDFIGHTGIALLFNQRPYYTLDFAPSLAYLNVNGNSILACNQSFQNAGAVFLNDVPSKVSVNYYKQDKSRLLETLIKVNLGAHDIREKVIIAINNLLRQGSPNFFEGGPDNKETISSRAGQIIQS